MKHLLLIGILLGCVGLLEAAPVPFSNVRDYGYMWWRDGMAGGVYEIQTSHYAMAFDVTNLQILALSPLKNPPSESAALVGRSALISSPSPSVDFSCSIVADGHTNQVGASGLDKRDSQLVECGKFFQRRWQKISLLHGPSFNANLSGLEIAAWPDRISFVLRIVPTNSIANGLLEMKLGLPDLHGRWFSRNQTEVCQSPNGIGLTLLKSAGSSSLEMDVVKGVAIARTTAVDWKAGEEYSVGLVIDFKATNVLSATEATVAEKLAPLSVTASSLDPAVPNLPVSYDLDRGWYDIHLPKGDSSDPDAMTRTHLSLSNSTARPVVARLNFDGVPFYIPGLTAVLRDADLNPMGIPVQLSKDWHNGTKDRWIGDWFHGLTMLTVPARSSLDLELDMAGQNWGGMPAATHSQLSVIGYGGNQQWDEAALGNHGEALTYDVDHVLTDNDCADSRPMLTTNDRGDHNAWGANSGGASFLRYVDLSGNTHRHISMRTRYKRYCPNLAEAIYAGRTDDGAIEFSISAALFRSDDYTRGYHHFRMDVKKDTRFNRLVFFQEAGDTYHYNRGTNYAYGNAKSVAPLGTWSATFNRSTNIGVAIPLRGPMPWAESLDCPAEPRYSAGDYGFVIRSWRSRINGRKNVPPYLVERSVAKGSILDLVPPPEVTSLKAGDFVEAEIVRFYLSQNSTNYYGPNENFRTALNKYQDTGALAAREAIGNNLKVKVRQGVLEHLYPVQIRAAKNRAAFTITGGLGYAPVTITGLTSFQSPILEERIGGIWYRIDQSVHGKDFWQCDYNAETSAWEITFNVNLDSADYQDVKSLLTSPQTHSFRLHIP